MFVVSTICGAGCSVVCTIGVYGGSFDGMDDFDLHGVGGLLGDSGGCGGGEG